MATREPTAFEPGRPSYASAGAAARNAASPYPDAPSKDDISSALKSLDLDLEELQQLTNRAHAIANALGALPSELEPIGPSPEPCGILGSLRNAATDFARLNSILSLRLGQIERAIG